MTVCEGNDVTIICEYNNNITLNVAWKINNKTYIETEIANNPSYQLIVKYTLTLLTVFSINETTDFQCIIPSPTNPNQTIPSRRVTVTVKGVCTYIPCVKGNVYFAFYIFVFVHVCECKTTTIIHIKVSLWHNFKTGVQ